MAASPSYSSADARRLMKGQTETVVVVTVTLHHPRQGHVASIIVLLSDSGSGYSQRQGHVACTIKDKAM